MAHQVSQQGSHQLSQLVGQKVLDVVVVEECDEVVVEEVLETNWAFSSSGIASWPQLWHLPHSSLPA